MVKRSSKKNASSNQQQRQQQRKQQQQRQQQRQQQQHQHEQRKIPAFTRLIFGVLVIYEITFVIFSSNSQQRSNFMSNFEFAPPSSSSSSLAATATTYDVSNKAVTAPSEKSNNNNINNNSEQDDALLSYSNTIIINDVYKYQPPKIDSRGNENNGCGASPDFNIWSSIPRVYNRSHHGEDIIIYNLFFKDHIYNNNNVTAATTDGGAASRDEVMTYVELGAFDGRRESNTHFYDYCLGWKGLLLEGNPVKYKELLINRPNSHKMNFAPSCNDWNTTVTFFTSEKTNAGIKNIAKGYNSNRNNDIEHDVPCGPLGPILEKVFQSNNYRINFFSLDVEGAERLVLDTIDFNKVHIDILMIEVINTFCRPNDSECIIRKQVREKMVNELGYIKYENMVPASDIYVHPNSKYQMKK